MSDVLDAAGRGVRARDDAGVYAGRPPKGTWLSADPPTIEEIASVMRAAGDGTYGPLLRGFSVILWRACLAFTKRSHSAKRTPTIVAARSSHVVGKEASGAKSGWMSAWEDPKPWIARRIEIPVGPLFRGGARRDAFGRVASLRQPRRATAPSITEQSRRAPSPRCPYRTTSATSQCAPS
jgi:hypothetical protein